MDQRGKTKLLSKLKDAMEKCEMIHPSGPEEETFGMFKGLKLEEKEELIQEREGGEPAICTSSEFAQQGAGAILKTEKTQVKALKTEEYDPDRDERKFGLCMKTFLCLCFCSCWIKVELS